MQISKFTIDKKFFSWGESIAGTVTFKMGANESIASAYNGTVTIELAPIVSVDGVPQYDEFGGLWQVITLATLNGGIAKGAAKTLSFSSVLPENTGAWETSAENYGVNLSGADRLQPFYLIRVSASDEYNGGRYYAAEKQSDGTGGFLYARIAPSYSKLTFADDNPKDPYAVFGGYVLGGQSRPAITSEVALDPLDPTLTAVHKLELLTVPEPNSAAGSEIITSVETAVGAALNPVLPASLGIEGAQLWRYTVTDSAGLSTQGEGSIALWNYVKPVLIAIDGREVAERYSIVTDDSGASEYVAADDGQNVRFSFGAYVSTVGPIGANTWTIDLNYGADGTDGETLADVMSGTDMASGPYPDVYSILSDTSFSAASRYFFTFTLTDRLGNSAKLTAYIEKSGGYFNVEKNGVAVGMRSTATALQRLFEVASTHEARFYGGIRGVTIYSTDEVDTGGRWINGKSVYAKTLVIENTTTAVTNTDVGVIADLMWVDMSASFVQSGATIHHAGYQGTTGVQYLIAQVTADGVSNAIVTTKTAHTGATIYLRVLYTKTEDSSFDPNADYALLMDSDGYLLVDKNGYQLMVEVD